MGISKRKFVRVAALTVMVVLALTGIAVAASNGTYTGKSTSNGKSYKFGLKVSGGKIVGLAGAAALTGAMNKTNEPYSLQLLAEGLSAVAARLEPKEAREVAAE